MDYSIEKSVNVDVDVDLDEFETDVIAKYLIENIDDVKEKTLEDLKKCLRITNVSGFPSQSIVDQMKLEHLQEVFDKYSIEELKQMLP
jgi:hypothetical protein